MGIDRNYCTPAEMARLTGYHRTTIMEWIKNGKIEAFKGKKPNCRNRIQEKYFSTSFINKSKKNQNKWGKTWSQAEIIILKNAINVSASVDVICKLLPNRTKMAIKIKKSRLKNN